MKNKIDVKHLRSEHRVEIDELRSEHEEEIETMKEEHASKISQLQYDMNVLKQQYQRQVCISYTFFIKATWGEPESQKLIKFFSDFRLEIAK